MGVVAKLLDVETLGSYIQRFLLGMLPEQLPPENMIEHVFVITEPKLISIVIKFSLLGCMIGIALTSFYRARMFKR